MVGQEKLLSRLKSYRLAELPRALLLLGEEGCGKHTLAKEIADYFGLGLIQIDGDIDNERLLGYRQSPVPSAYFIDIGSLMEKQQNKFLKFIEEPGESAFIILSATSEIGVLPTVLNRCVACRFENYTKEQLQALRPGLADKVYEIYRTPGQLLTADDRMVGPMERECRALLAETKKARAAKIIGYACKINYKEEYGKFDFIGFFRMLERVALEDYAETDNADSYKIYRLTAEYMKRLSYKTISKENFALSYFCRLQEIISNG